MRGSEMVSFALWYDSFLVDSWGICQQQCRVLELIWLEWFDLCSVQCDRVILCFFMFFPKWQNMVVQRLHACHLAEFAAGVLCKSRNSRHGSLPYLTGCRNRRTCWTCTILNKYIYMCGLCIYIYIYIDYSRLYRKIRNDHSCIFQAVWLSVCGKRYLLIMRTDVAIEEIFRSCQRVCGENLYILQSLLVKWPRVGNGRPFKKHVDYLSRGPASIDSLPNLECHSKILDFATVIDK